MTMARREWMEKTGRYAGLGLLLSSLSACIPLVVGGAVVGGSLVATDRRTTGIQVEDQNIELRGASRISDGLRGRGRVSLTSFNRQVLLTGEVPTEQEKQLAQRIVAELANVQGVVNEIDVMPNSSLTQRSSDSLITGKIKASLVDTKDLFANAFKVVTERDVVFLMGRVTQREADRATSIARTTSGVRRVVRVFEILTEQELQGLTKAAATK